MALCVSNRNPRCIVELKSAEYDLKRIGRSDGDRQLFEYSFHAGAPLALLTNGVNWRFYSTQSAGTYEECLVRSLDIETDAPEKVAVALDRYLSYSNTESGKAADFAREDLNARIDRHKARETIPRAWAHLVEGDLDARLADLLIETTASLTEARPARKDVADFLSRLKPEAHGNRPRKSHKAVAPPRLPPAVGARNTATVRYWLLGAEKAAKNAKEAYIAVFAALAERDPDFLNRVAPKLRGRKNRGVAQAKPELSSNYLMVKSGVRLPGDWWLLTHLSNPSKIQSLRIACEAAGIRYGNRDSTSVFQTCDGGNRNFDG